MVDYQSLSKEFMINSNGGSAYLFVLGIIVIAMFILMASMRRSVESNKQTFSIEQHTIAQNQLDSCETFIFHVVKTWPFDKHPELEQIVQVVNQNDKNSFYYGLKMKPKSGSNKSKKSKKTKSK